MNKRIYIFVTNSIYGLGGAQLLTLRRSGYLRDKGWRVLIIYRRKMGEFRLESDFKEFDTLFIPEFTCHYNFVNNRKKLKITNQISEYLSNIDKENSFIESNDLVCAVWAEYLSQVFGIKHALYMLSEENINRLFYYPYKRFYEYKLYRNELWGCNSRGLEISFGKLLPQFNTNYVNVAYNEDEIPDVSLPSLILEKKKNTIVVSTLTRLEKEYLPVLIEVIGSICIKRKDIDVCFVIGGGSVENKVENRIRKMAEEMNRSISNLHIIITGYIKPGKDFFSQTDIFIGMGTAAISALSQGCIVLPVNPITNKTPGVFGVETFNFAYPESNVEFLIFDKILQLLLLSTEKRYDYAKQSKEYYNNNFTLDVTFDAFRNLCDKMQDVDTYSFKNAYFFKPLDYIVELARRIRSLIYFIIGKMGR